MKKNKLLTLLLGMVFSGLAHSNQSALTALEINDPDLAGGTYDLKMELGKKVGEIDNLAMTPDQSDVIKRVFLERQRAISTPYVDTATPITRSINVKFGAGSTPPIIRLSSNMLTTLVFTDSAGDPWAIESVALNRSMFSDGSDVRQATGLQNNSEQPASSERVRNFLTLEPLNSFAYSNVAITLKDLETPVIFILAAGQSEVDVRVDARIAGINPNKKTPPSCVSGCFSRDIDDLTLLFVDGTPPSGAIPLVPSSNEIEAWEYGGSLVVRTTRSVIYPSYSSSVTSSGGVTVYKFDRGVNNITVSKGSSAQTIHIEKE